MIYILLIAIGVSPNFGSFLTFMLIMVVQSLYLASVYAKKNGMIIHKMPAIMRVGLMIPYAAGLIVSAPKSPNLSVNIACTRLEYPAGLA